MRVELLFFRWLLVIALVAGAVLYFGSSPQPPTSGGYETVRLMEDGRSSGMPLAGVVVDRNHRDVYGIVEKAGPAQSPRPFVIFWQEPGGQTFATSIGPGGSHRIFEVTAEGAVNLRRDLAASLPDTNAPGTGITANTETSLRSMITALPESSRPR
ncbi:MAG: hypothetical protein ABI992_04125 [Chthoniobacterales bacterium]